MKLIFEKFYCPVCKQNKWLKIENICVDCHDKRKLQEFSRIRKNNHSFENVIYLEHCH